MPNPVYRSFFVPTAVLAYHGKTKAESIWIKESSKMGFFEFAGIRLSAGGITTGNEGMNKQKFDARHCENLARKSG